jgi:hypothetical protein
MPTGPRLDDDDSTFAFVQPGRAQPRKHPHDRKPEVERAEFLLAIGNGLARGP